MKRIFSDLVHTSLRSYLLSFRSVLSFDATDLLRRIVVPTLILEGTADSVFPPEIAQELHERIIRSRLRYIDSNHIIVLNNPSELVSSIDLFYQKLSLPLRRSLVSSQKI